MKLRKIVFNLTFWVLLSIITGILVGHSFPEVALKQVLANDWKIHLLGQELKVGKTLSEFLSGIFISVVKLFIVPIIFLTITLGLVGMDSLKRVGKLGFKALLYFEVVTTLALIIGIVVANIIRPGDGVQAAVNASQDLSKYTQQAAAFSWLQFFKDNVTLQVLLLALIAGVLLGKHPRRQPIITVLTKVSKIVFQGLHRVMLLAPVGAFGGMAFTIAKYGLKSLLPLAKLMTTVYITMALFIFVVLGLLMRYYKVRLLSFLNYIREELLIVLGTSSSEAALPNLMEKLERMGCSRSVVGLVVPTGYSFNLDGTTIYLSMAIIFMAQVYGVQLDSGQMITIIGILMITSKGAAGVTGSGFVVLASTLATIQVIPLEGLTLLLGVDRFLSEARAITNFIGNGVATIFLANNENEFDVSKMQSAFSHVVDSEMVL